MHHKTIFSDYHPSPASVIKKSMLLLIIFVLSFSGAANAVEQNTVFLPLKINSSSTTDELTQKADKAVITALEKKNFTMLSRSEAEKLVDYQGAWPPSTSQLKKIADSTGLDYIAAGTLTVIADQISLDFKIYDLLSENPPTYYYKHGESLNKLSTATTDIINKILAFTGSDHIIASIAPRGNKRIDSGAILRKVKTKAGDNFDPSKLRRDLKNIFKMGFFQNVQIDAEDSPTGKKIFFTVIEKPVISRVKFTGTDEIDLKEVKEAANISTNSILNPTKINEAVIKIKALYKSKGYNDSKVRAELSYPSQDKAIVEFLITEGEKIFIRKISFIGNSTFTDDELEDVIETSEKGWLSFVTESGLVKIDKLRQDAGRLGAFYHNNGFMEAKIGKPEIKEEGEGLHVIFTVSEGPRYRIGTITLSGDLITEKQTLMDLLSIRNEEYMNRRALHNDTLKITDYYSEQGYAFAQVKQNLDKSESGKRINIELVIQKRELVSINRIDIRGNTTTRDNVLRRELLIAEGGIFDSTALRASKQRIQRLDFFEEVNIIPTQDMDPSKMNVTVEIKEKNTGQFSLGVGYSSVDSLMFMGEIAENNFLGRGDRLAFKANISGTSDMFNLSYTNPRLFDSRFSWGADLFNWAREYDDYDKESKGGALKFGFPIWNLWRGFGNYSYTDTELTNVSPYASSVILDSLDIKITSAVKFGLSRDTRNKLYNASSGSRHLLSVKYAGGPLGGDAEFTKLEGSTSWFFGMIWDTVFHVKASAGQVIENETDKLPVYERFYLGGLNSIRGFEYGKVSPVECTDIEGIEYCERIGGDKMWYTNMEIVFPLLEEAGIQGVVFFDMGEVYATDQDWTLDDYNKSVGVELRWLSPMGPLRIVWGKNMDPEEDEDTSVWDFSIGGSF